VRQQNVSDCFICTKAKRQLQSAKSERKSTTRYGEWVRYLPGLSLNTSWNKVIIVSREVLQLSLNKERIDAVKFMRVTAMLLVILIHATGVALSKIPHDSPSYFFYLFLNRFTRFEGSVFVFLSGLTLFYNYESKPFTKQTWSNFYKRRFMFILGPFLIWSIFYELFSYYQGVRVFTDWKTMFTSIVTGGAYYHLYFILILVQLYFLMPLFIYLVKRFWWFKKYLLFIGFAVELAVQSYFEMFQTKRQ